MTTNVQKFLTALVGPFQTAEDSFQQLLIERSVNTAIGVQLDAIGKLVGRERQGITDDELYRRYIRAQIATNKSDGLIEDVLAIADLVVFDDDATYVVDANGNASFELRVEIITLEYDVANILILYLRRAVAGGVRVILEFSTAPSETTFTFSDDATDQDDAIAGWSDSTELTSGGDFSSAIE